MDMPACPLGSPPAGINGTALRPVMHEKEKEKELHGMFRIIKVLNNNSILVLSNETKREYILMGNGIGFGKMPGQQIESMKGAKVYSLVTRKKKQSALKAVNAIDPVYLEISGEIIDLAEEEFSQVNRDILLAMADHIALAAKRAKENMQFPNPFTRDIQMLFSREFQVALKGREVIRAKTGYVISDDEAGLIALHIHAGLSDEMVSETLEATRIIEECIAIIEEHFQTKIPKDSLAYARMMSHLYYMAARTRKDEPLKVDMNDYIYEKYPQTAKASELVCAHMGKEMKKEIRKEEIGFLGIHIQRILSE